ncbi:MAG: DUF2075 domain-containing protein [Sumerlaeia bacterium]
MPASLHLLGEPNLPEFRMAERFGHRLCEALNAHPGCAASEIEVYSVPSLQCFGQRIQDVDQLVLLRARPGLELTWRETRLRIESLCFAMEHKAHGAGELVLRDQHLFVRYEGREGLHNASRQAEVEAMSARAYLRDLAGGRPFVGHGIFLSAVDREALPDGVPHLLGSNFTAEDFLRFLTLSRCGRDVMGRLTFRQDFDFEEGIAALERARRPVEISALNKVRLDRITRRYLTSQNFQDHIGNRLFIYHGRAGTGKTTFLLRMANDLALDGHRPLFLTYNHALRLDLATMLQSSAAAAKRRSVQIPTDGLNSFMHDVFVALGLQPTRHIPNPYEANYAGRLAESLDTLTPERVAALRADPQFDFDFVFIDEAQDILEVERQVLGRIYGERNLIISNGFDQVMRDQKCDWTRGLVKDQDYYLHRYGRSLRMRERIVTFANALAQELGTEEWSVQSNPDLPGGRVVVRVGPYNPQLHDVILEDLKAAECEWGDLLFGWNQPRRTVAALKDQLERAGYHIWDGTDHQARRNRRTMLEPDEIRFYDYQSVRGLECWTFVAMLLDEYFDREYKRELAHLSGEDLAASVSASQAAAYRILMACTRPINTLAITLKNPDSPLGRAIAAVARANPGLIEGDVP